MQIGDKIIISKKTRILLGLPDNGGYYIKDILTKNFKNKYVVGSYTLGKDWVEFFSEDELIKI